MSYVTLYIDGKKGQVPSHFTVLDAAKSLNIYIPTLCDHPLLSPFGGCRLCVVEVKGISRPVTACTTPVSDEMEVLTSTPRLQEMRKTFIELLLSDHPQDCIVCEASGECSLQELAYFYGIRENRFIGTRRVYEDDDKNPFIKRDMQKCILCGRCVRICSEIQGVHSIDFTDRGFYTKVTTAYDRDLKCEYCGQCVSVCPTGALTGKQWSSKGRTKDVKKVDTVCPYCGAGCQITLHVRGQEVIRVSSDIRSHN
ncbi:MAG: 2Fe-2S iron-sulfur cluster-binding protein, partial [Thermodesulfovibrionales bacterium]